MTAKRTNSGELEVVNIGGKTFSYRTILLLLVASATPMADPVFKAFGISKPEIRLEQRFADAETKIETIHKDLTKLNQAATAVQDKLTQVDFRLTGFQVDFEKYKAAHP